MKAILRKILAGILAVIMVIGTVASLPSQSAKADTVEHLIINQVYGGGGKGDTPITNSFIELYNPTADSINLNGYSIVCGNDKLELSAEASMEAGTSYLIICNPEETTDDYITYDLPEADQEWAYTIDNKEYTIDLVKDETIIDTAVADENVSAIEVSKQKSLRRKNYSDTDTNDDWQVIVWEKESVTVDQAYVELYAPRNSKGEMGSVHTASQEPAYTPVIASSNKVAGVNNGNNSLDMELIARHNSGAMSADGGSLEIVEYNSVNGYAYAVSGLKGKVIAVKVSDVENGETVEDLSGTEYDVKELVDEKAADEGFVYGDTTSVAISPDGTKLAAAIQHNDYDKAGVVAIFECNLDGTLTNPELIHTGVQPDMVVFADDNTVLTADEGEPRNGYSEGSADPKGTVSIINLADNTSTQAGFENFTIDELVAKNVILGIANEEIISPENDLEPEYIAVSSDKKTAYVSLQEANAIGVLDIESKQFTGVYSIGFEDYSKVAVDLVEDSKYEATTYENLVGARMPDGIAVYENEGKTYVVTANEGDAREWGDYANEAKTKDFTGENIRVLDSSLCAGLPEGKTVMFGGRNFTILEVTAEGLREVFDSGNDFERISAEAFPEYFNCSNDDNEIDSRSTKKGPEPENVTVGQVNGKTYAFAALERVGGIMVYDITDPENSTYVNYINSREFDTAIQGDDSPEGLCFVESNKAGYPMILSACEVSGTLAVYELKSNIKEPGEDPTTEEPTTEGQTTNPGTVQTPEAQTPVSPVTVPAKAKIKKIAVKKKSAKKLKLTVRKVNGAVGYQVAVYKTKKNAKQNKKAIVKKFVTKRKVTIISKKLKGKKKLFVRVRAYKTEANGKKVYGKWSAREKVVIK